MCASTMAFSNVGLGRFDTHVGPQSRFLQVHGSNGSDVPTGGAVWYVMLLLIEHMYYVT